MISAVLIYGPKGEVLASRVYKDGLRRAITDTFRVQVISAPENQTPLLTLGSTSFLHVRHNSLYVVAVTRHNVDAALVYEFLYKLSEVLETRLGSFDEASCYRNVTQIYEILDEFVDFGYPQITELSALNQYLTEGAYGSDTGQEKGLNGNGGGASGGSSGNSILGGASVGGGLISSLARRATSVGSSSQTTAPSSSSISSVPWRSGDIKHRRNEAYIDVLESLHMVVDPSGRILNAYVDGRIKMKAKLSGMPDCRLALTDSKRVTYEMPTDGGNSQSTDDTDEAKALERLEDCQLHECVNHRRYQSSHTIAFLPPEGEFELMRYRVTEGITIPFELRNEMEGDDTHVVTLRCLLEPKQQATNVSVHVPTFNTDPHRFKGSTGKARYNPGESRVEWKIGRMTGGSEVTLRLPLQYHAQTRSQNAKMPPITLDFQMNMFTCSGLKVKYLRIVESNSKYATLKWVRYLTKAGYCEARVPL